MVLKKRCRNWPRGTRSRFSRVSANSSRKESSGAAAGEGSLGLTIGFKVPTKKPSLPQRGFGIAGLVARKVARERPSIYVSFPRRARENQGRFGPKSREYAASKKRKVYLEKSRSYAG